MALAQGDLLVGINAVGLPVFNAQGVLEFCIVAIDTEMFLPLDAQSEKLAELKSAVAAINRFCKTAKHKNKSTALHSKCSGVSGDFGC